MVLVGYLASSGCVVGASMGRDLLGVGPFLTAADREKFAAEGYPGGGGVIDDRMTRWV